MKVAKVREQTNVCLVWEGVNEVKGEKTFCQYWRILAVATRHIRPFDQLIHRGGSNMIGKQHFLDLRQMKFYL
jgi:hypothetical protein